VEERREQLNLRATRSELALATTVDVEGARRASSLELK